MQNPTAVRNAFPQWWAQTLTTAMELFDLRTSYFTSHFRKRRGSKSLHNTIRGLRGAPSKAVREEKAFSGKRKSDGQKTVASVLALPILPGRCQPSIVSRDELNYRVRNGNGWTLILISTNYCHLVSQINNHYKLVFAPCQYLLEASLVQNW